MTDLPIYFHQHGQIYTRINGGEGSRLPIEVARELITHYRAEESNAGDANDLNAANWCLRRQMELISAVSDYERFVAKRADRNLRDFAQIVYPPQFWPPGLVPFPQREGVV